MFYQLSPFSTQGILMHEEDDNAFLFPVRLGLSPASLAKPMGPCWLWPLCPHISSSFHSLSSSCMSSTRSQFLPQDLCTLVCRKSYPNSAFSVLAYLSAFICLKHKLPADTSCLSLQCLVQMLPVIVGLDCRFDWIDRCLGDWTRTLLGWPRTW